MRICPLPTLDTTLTEINRILFLTLPNDQFRAYESALLNLKSHPNHLFTTIVARVHEHFATSAANSDFKSLLLSQRAPPFQTLIVPIHLSALPTFGNQLNTASNLLFRLAVIAADRHRHLSVASDRMELDQDQANNFLCTARLPGRETDRLVSFPDSCHVTVWVRGKAFALDILDAARSPKSVVSIERSLERMVTQASGLEQTKISVASLSWNLPRQQWFETRALIQAHGDNASSLVRLESAIAAIALESFTPQSPANTLENLRSGTGSVNRYADQVLNLVVYANGAAGLSVDHAPVDGDIANQLAEALSSSNIPSHSNTETEPAPFHHLLIDLPSSLSIPNYPDKTARTIRVLSLGPSDLPCTMKRIRHSRLVPFMIHMSVQSALFSIRERLPHAPLVVQPVSMRRFTRGRAHPSYPVTTASVALVGALRNRIHFTGELQKRQELCDLFGEALIANKKLIKAVKYGTSVGPHLVALFSALIENERASKEPEIQTVLEAWSRFTGMNGPMVSVTGFAEARGVENGMGNVYGPDQLMGWYTWHEDTNTVSISLHASGAFAEVGVVDRIAEEIQGTFSSLVEVAADYLAQ